MNQKLIGIPHDIIDKVDKENKQDKIHFLKCIIPFLLIGIGLYSYEPTRFIAIFYPIVIVFAIPPLFIFTRGRL